MMKRIKPLKPSLREKKRYVVYQVLSENPVTAQESIDAVTSQALSFLGESGMARLGMERVDVWEDTTQQGILRVNHNHLDAIHAVCSVIHSINGKPATVTIKGVSGVLSKAQSKYMKTMR